MSPGLWLVVGIVHLFIFIWLGWLTLWSLWLRQQINRVDSMRDIGEIKSRARTLESMVPQERQASPAAPHQKVERRYPIRERGDLEGPRHTVPRKGGETYHGYRSDAEASDALAARSPIAESASPAPPPSPTSSAAEAVADYNSLSSKFSQEALERFSDVWRPITVEEAGDRLFENPDGPLWFIPDRYDANLGIVVPGGEAIRTWEKFYRSMHGMKAKSLLASIYAVREGPFLAIDKPALAHRGATGMRIVDKGELSGV